MSNLRADSISDRAGTGPIGLVGQSAAKAFATFSPSGALFKNLNVSSLTDGGTGDFTVNFTTAFADNLGATVTGIQTSSSHSDIVIQKGNNLTTAQQLKMVDVSSITLAETNVSSAAMHLLGDLA